MKPLLSIRNLHVRVGDADILKGLSLDLRPGEVHALMGPNGSGKSTLLKAMLGLVPLDSGSVTVDGLPLISMTARQRAATMSGSGWARTSRSASARAERPRAARCKVKPWNLPPSMTVMETWPHTRG